MLDLSRPQRFKDFLRSPEGQKTIAELIRLHWSELVVAIPRLVALWEEIERTRLSLDGRSLSEIDPGLFEAGEDWLWRPVVAGLCRYESVIDGTLDLADLARMNRLIDATQSAKVQFTRKPSGLAAERKNAVRQALLAGRNPYRREITWKDLAKLLPGPPLSRSQLRRLVGEALPGRKRRRPGTPRLPFCMWF
jgi:hypothetical protein